LTVILKDAIINLLTKELMSKDSRQTEIEDQVDVQKVCENLGIGRYDLIELSAQVARALELRPHDALKRLLEVDDLDEFVKTLKENELAQELKGVFKQKF
jgi:hypothetical protein|tara:strand:- start:479 stop:778 length:300 start_codon:yes stop_codon:yes gene_type:complete